MAVHPDLDRDFVPGMGKRWLLPLYDPFCRLAGVRRIHAELLDRADVRPGAHVLEIGCGTGNLLTALGRRRRDMVGLGIDPDPAALRRARRKAARIKINIRYERAYADELPLPDGSVDRVLSSLMLHHLSDDERAGALRETRRVLRPGGELHILDVDGSASGHGRTARGPRVAAVLPDRLLPALREAGFSGVAQNGHGRFRFGDFRFAFYRAVR